MRLTNTFDAAVDEYLHLIARVCPWELPREQPRLQGFAAWLGRQGRAPADLEAVEPAMALRHAHEDGLGAGDTEALMSALAGLYRWAARDGRVGHNPFSGAHELARAVVRSSRSPQGETISR